jgi:serine/threonine-protein kinase
MGDARWNRLWNAFHAALSLPPGERAAALAEYCGDDPGLRDEVASLLAAHDATASPLDRPPPALAAPVDWPDFGPWRVRREIGRGGMGVVLEVERTDGAYAQRAALKLIDPLFAHGAAVERFLRERRILARLRHPRIARLLDGGRTADGQPWLVMDYVEGETIDRWCRAHDADVATRVRLLAEVAEAVDFAHRQLVVHRDLKPGNVLVAADGLPMLLDFGIARSLDPADTAATAAGESRPLTVAYASPEQLDGAPPGVACDVHALGVMAWELFAGCRPYETEGLSWADLAARMRADGPPPLRAPAGAPRLPPELGWICARAMQPDPARRYPSAQALADDLRALLAHRPVAARPPGGAYVLRKFLRRRWPWVAVAALFLATVGGFVWRLSQEAAATRAALAASEVERVRAERVAAFLADLFRAADTTQSGGRERSAREVLDRGREALASRDDLPPPARLLLLNALAGVYRNLGAYAEAAALLGEAQALLPAVASPALEAETLENLGAVRELAGQSREARAALERALELRRAQRPPDPDAEARVAERLAATLQTLGERDAAGALFAAAWAQRRALPEGDPRRADSALRYGSWHWVAGRLDEAAVHYAQALAARRAQQPPDLPELARALDAAAALAHARGRYADALPLFEEALALRRRVLGESHRLTADSLSNLGALHVDRGEPAAAIAPLRAALATYASVLPPGSVVPAKAHNNLGLALQATGELDAAGAAFQAALALNRAAHGPRHPRVAGNLNNLALLHERRGDLDGAESALREALSIIEAAQGTAHASLGFPLTNLGRVRLWQGASEEARELLLRALAIRREALPAGHGQIADTLGWLAVAQCTLGDAGAAAAALDEASAIRTAAASAGPDDLAAIRGACLGDPRWTPSMQAAWAARRGDDDRLLRWARDIARRRPPAG